MARQDDLADRERRIIKFMRAVNETAAKFNSKDTALIAIAFVFCLLWETLDKIGQAAGLTKSELANTRDKWTYKDGDK